MIRYDLLCAREDAFEGWFRDSADFDAQAEAGEISCPHCGSAEIRKAVMAPAVLRRGRGEREPAGVALERLAAEVRAHIRENFDYVGERFAEEARRRHENGEEHGLRPIWGEAAPHEAESLIEAGAPVAPLPAIFAPPPPTKLN